MGLFKKKTAGANVPEPPTTPPMPQTTVNQVAEYVNVNIMDKMLRVELVGDNAFIRDCIVHSNENHIQIEWGGILIADIGKRSKAYKELEPYVDRQSKSVTIVPKEGEYGPYYQLRMKFEHTEIISN